MVMQHGHAAWTCSSETRGHEARKAEWTWSMDMKHVHAASACKMGMQNGHAVWKSRMNVQHFIYKLFLFFLFIIMFKQNVHAAWT
jgi:hypothetical protein